MPGVRWKTCRDSLIVLHHLEIFEKRLKELEANNNHNNNMLDIKGSIEKLGKDLSHVHFS